MSTSRVRRLPAREPVPLERAFRWHCPECRETNYVDPLRVEFKHEADRRRAYLALGLIDVYEATPPASDGLFIVAPGVVECGTCRRKFPAIDSSDTADMEDDDGDG